MVNEKNKRESIDKAAVVPVNDSEIACPDLIRDMRKIGTTKGWVCGYPKTKDVVRFLSQARFMVLFEDDYDRAIPFECRMPVYEDMDIPQLRCYFSWRADVRKGIITKISLSYVYLYVYELINLIGTGDAVEAFKKLASFWLSYRVYDAGIDRSLHSWVKDVYIYNSIPVSFKKLVVQNGLEQYYPELFLDSRDDKYYFNLYQLSHRKLEQSGFIDGKRDRISFIEKCFLLVIPYVDVLMKLDGLSFRDVIEIAVDKSTEDKTAQRTKPYKPFDGAIYQFWSKRERTVVISEDSYYQYREDEWYSSVPFMSDYHYEIPRFFGYVVELIEYALRDISGNHDLYLYSNTAIDAMTAGFDLSQEQAVTFKKTLSDPLLKDIIAEIVGVCFSQALTDPALSFDVSRIAVQDADIPLCRSLTLRSAQEPYASFTRMSRMRNADNSYDAQKKDKREKTGYAFQSIKHKHEYHAARFCAQAAVITGLTDTYDEIAPMTAAIPLFDAMNSGQLRTYVTWRTQFRLGNAVSTHRAYIILYTFELINGIETQSSDEVIEKLSDLLKTYDSDARLALYLTNVIRDYFVCFISEGDFSELALRHNIENYYPCLFFGKKNIPNPLAFYGKISSYNIAGSVFYTDVHAELLNQCFAECLERIGLFLGERSIDFRELGIHDIRNSSDWKPFKDAVCGMPIVQGKKSVEISEFEEYYRVHYAWICGAYAELEQGISQLIGYILKRMESIMRNIVHFKGKLNADAAPMALKIRNYSKKQTAIVNLMRDPSFTELIDETVAYWFQKHHPEVFTDPKSIYKKPITIEVDFGKLDQIRSDAAEIQGKLILYDDLPEEEVQPKASSHAPIIHDEIETAGGLEGFVSRLSPEEREMVAIILDKQQQRLAQFALDKQLLIEVLLEHINEIALECIGDTVIDTGSDPVFIYDEYEKELSYMLSTIY